MATANITRDEAIARSRVISTEAYRVTVDLTGREVAEPERVFLSTTELSLTAHGGDTYVDLIADEFEGGEVGHDSETVVTGAPVGLSSVSSAGNATPQQEATNRAE